MPRAGLSRAGVVDLAVELADVGPDGFDGLTLAAVAARAGVAVPSLYKHVASLADLRDSVALVGVREAERRTSAATVGVAGEEALRALAAELRRFASDHPGLYAASQRPGSVDTGLAAAQTAVVDVVVAVLRGFDLPEHRAVDAVRVIRSAVHGFVDLEAHGGFGMPDDVDRSFDALVEVLVIGVRQLASPGSG